MWFEMRETLLALPHLREDILYQSVLHVIATENTKVVAYSKNQGDIHCFWSSEKLHCIHLCSQLQLPIQVRHISDRFNAVGNALSMSLAPLNI